jgi:hypothetical protein
VVGLFSKSYGVYSDAVHWHPDFDGMAGKIDPKSNKVQGGGRDTRSRIALDL